MWLHRTAAGRAVVHVGPSGRRGSRHIAFVGIDTKDVREKARSFVESNHISYPIVFDDRARVAVAMGRLPVAGLPFTALIDRRQRVAAVYVGAVTPRDLQPVLDRLAAEPL